MTIEAKGAPDHVSLTGIRWGTYQALLEDLGDRRLRLTFDSGDLEISAREMRHEWYSRLLCRFDGRRLSAWALGSGDEYDEAPTSLAFPFLRVKDLLPFLRRAKKTDETTVVREFLAWVRQNLSAGA
mgnify:CR=1 FL=1